MMKVSTCTYSIFMLLISGVSSLQHCLYPPQSSIEPCICEVDEEYHILLTCSSHVYTFSAEDFQRVTTAFDFNNNIYNFTIDLTSTSYDFEGQLDSHTLGKLNVTYLTMKNLGITNSLLMEGAFDGSYGSIREIIIDQGIWNNREYGVDLGSASILNATGPTLEKLKLSYVTNLTETTFSENKEIREISLRHVSLDYIPNGTFSSEYFPKVEKISIFDGEIVNFEDDAFLLYNLPQLKSLVLRENNLKTLSLSATPYLEELDLSDNKELNHTGLGTSLLGLYNTNIGIDLGNTDVRELAENTFRPLVELMAADPAAAGFIDMKGVDLDCGCDLKWLILEVERPEFFRNARCYDGMSLTEIDPILFEMMCP